MSITTEPEIGELALLNVGTGDTKITFDPNGSEDDKRNAAAVVKDMLRRGYAVLVEVGKDDRGPLYRRALDFDENTHEYIVAGLPPELAEAQEEVSAPAKPRKTPGRTKGRKSTTRVPASRTKAVGVSRTAGG